MRVVKDEKKKVFCVNCLSCFVYEGIKNCYYCDNAEVLALKSKLSKEELKPNITCKEARGNNFLCGYGKFFKGE